MYHATLVPLQGILQDSRDIAYRYVSSYESRGVRGGTTEKGLMSDGSPSDGFYRKQQLFSFKKVNKQSAYGNEVTGNKTKYENGHTTGNV